MSSQSQAWPSRYAGERGHGRRDARASSKAGTTTRRPRFRSGGRTIDRHHGHRSGHAFRLPSGYFLIRTRGHSSDSVTQDKRARLTREPAGLRSVGLSSACSVRKILSLFPFPLPSSPLPSARCPLPLRYKKTAPVAPGPFSGCRLPGLRQNANWRATRNTRGATIVDGELDDVRPGCCSRWRRRVDVQHVEGIQIEADTVLPPRTE